MVAIWRCGNDRILYEQIFHSSRCVMFAVRRCIYWGEARHLHFILTLDGDWWLLAFLSQGAFGDWGHHGLYEGCMSLMMVPGQLFGGDKLRRTRSDVSLLYDDLEYHMRGLGLQISFLFLCL
jgi:hypothetical protein